MLKRILLGLAVVLALAACDPIPPTTGLDIGEPASQERPADDDPGWNCETMGNGVCGRVNVETWTDENGSWVQIWDEHNRLVFGPVLVEGYEG